MPSPPDPLEQQPLFDRFTNLVEWTMDHLQNDRRLIVITASVFAVSILATPLIFRIGMSQSISGQSPWWLEALMTLWSLSFLLGGFVLAAIGVARLMGRRPA